MIPTLPTWAVLGVGLLMGWLKGVWTFVYSHTIGYAVKKVTISLSIEDVEHAYAYMWLSYWVEQQLMVKKVNALLLRSDYQAGGGGQGYRIIPQYGTYYMRWRGNPMIISHTFNQRADSIFGKGTTLHTMQIQLWFTRRRQLLLDILEEAKTQYLATLPSRVEQFCWRDYWRGVLLMDRSIDSIYLPSCMLSDLLGDLDSFLKSKEQYVSLGVPYRRGYLLYGPPGTGKSSLILALATKFKLPVYPIALHSVEINHKTLSDMLNTCKSPSIIVFEDIDSVVAAVSRDGDKPGLKLSDLLNAIDGIGAGENRIIFMTANEPERLDPALVRPGRIDRKFHLSYTDDTELKRFYDRVSQHFKVSSWPEFRASLPRQATIADAQVLAFSTSLNGSSTH